MRLDAYMKETGMVATRSRAKMLIENGSVKINGIFIKKPAYEIKETDKVTLESDLPYVSRGGVKLAEALRAFSLSPLGHVALDIGASSGGFTDCLLQNGAKKVYALDSGSNQLVEELRNNSAVVCMEQYNARYMKLSDFEERPTFAVMDVSFISQTLILPAIAYVLPKDGVLVSLIKPQFEVGRAGVGRGGIVRDEKVRQKAIARVQEAAKACGLSPRGVISSPILGGDGNCEFLAYFINESEGA